jgi:hypothetical protein
VLLSQIKWLYSVHAQHLGCKGWSPELSHFPKGKGPTRTETLSSGDCGSVQLRQHWCWQLPKPWQRLFFSACPHFTTVGPWLAKAIKAALSAFVWALPLVASLACSLFSLLVSPSSWTLFGRKGKYRSFG